MAGFFLTNPNLKGATALQTALVKAGLLTADDVDDEYGPHTARACEAAKNRLGYPTAEIHPGHETADATLLAYLRGKRKLPPDFVARRRQRLGLDGDSPLDRPAGSETANQATRAEVVDEFRWLIAHEPQVGYAQKRPIPVGLARRTIPAGGIKTDCSGAILLACKWAGVPDPSGLGYSGAGFTGSFLTNLAHITRPMVQPGDLVVFGPGNGDHASLVLAPKGADLELGSHGSERGPVSVLLSAEAKYHRPPTVFLSLGV